MNGTQASSCSTNEKAEKITKTFAYCLISVVSLVGNTFIGIIVYKTKAMRKTTNFFIVNMAMSDLLLPIFLFPQIVTEFHYDSWLIRGPLGQALCKMYVLFANVSTTVSIQSLVLIAVDRFGAVVFPLRPPLINSKLCLFLISATWIVAMAVQSPYLVAYRLVEYSPGKLMCVRNWNVAFGKSSSYRNYILAIAVVFFYTPLTLISVLYCKIILKLKSQTIPGEQSVSAGQQRMKRERNVLKMAIAIVLGFAVCWLPFTIILLLRFFAWTNKTRHSCCIIRYFFIAQFMAGANCAINPCICLIFSGNYRQRLKNLLSCFRRLQRPSNQVAQTRTRKSHSTKL
ncbi:QRFP-like peptide receptor [Oculina patagonica]